MPRAFLIVSLVLAHFVQAQSNSSTQPSKSFKLEAVVITGSTRYLQPELVAATGLALNSQVTQDNLQDAATRLGASGAFSSVRFLFLPTATGTKATYQVTDNPDLLPIIFQNFVFTRQELEAHLHARIPLYVGQLPQAGDL
jgi:hypothetical protein